MSRKSDDVRLDDTKPWRFQYENWPRSVRIAYCCTFPVSAPLLMFSMMLGTIAAGLVLMAVCVVMLQVSLTRHVGGTLS